MRRLPATLGLLLVLLSSPSCLLWPFPTGGLLDGRGRITPRHTTPLVVGQATREEVLLRLGEPDGVAQGGRLLRYRWTEERGFLALVGQGTALVIPFPRRCELQLAFGPDGRLLHADFPPVGEAPAATASAPP
ncbi:MAG TPA: hypothetical protein VJ570_09140 [Holophagaceae bacterium]|nr:hypothetical protein [Holophagaceae bacterium]